MKIGFDAKRIFGNSTGLGNYSRSLVSNLKRFHPEQEYHLFTPEAKRTHYSAGFLDHGEFHIHQGKTRLKSYWRSFSIVKDLQASGIEVYHGLSNELPHHLQRSGIKSVVTIHDLIFKTQPETYHLSERLIYDRKFRYACRNADKIIAISEHTKKDITRLYDIDPGKIEVIYQSCDPLFYTLQTTTECEAILSHYALPAKYFLYVGSIERRKNLKLIIEAYRLASSEHNIPLVVVGKGGDYKEECQKMIAAYGLSQRFIWMDKLHDNRHLQALYQQSTALIYPSFYEGFGLPVAEALLSKTPVITSNTSSLPEAGGPGGFYIDPSDPKALAEAMQETISRDMSTRVAQGYQYAHETFAEEKLADQLIRCYQAI